MLQVIGSFRTRKTKGITNEGRSMMIYDLQMFVQLEKKSAVFYRYLAKID